MKDWNPRIQRNLSIQYIFTLGELLVHTLDSAPCWIPVLYLLSRLFLHLLAFSAAFLPSRICQMLCITITLNNFMENQQFMGHWLGYGILFKVNSRRAWRANGLRPVYDFWHEYSRNSRDRRLDFLPNCGVSLIVKSQKVKFSDLKVW